MANVTFWQLLIAVVVAALGSVPLWTLIGKVFELRWLKRKSDGELEEREINRLRTDLTEAREAHRACEQRLNEIENRIDAIEHHHASWVPRWIRNTRKQIIWINDAAILAIFAPLSLSREEVVGRTFSDLLDIEASREIDRLDRSALSHPGRPVSTLLQLHPRLRPMHVVKVAGVGRDRELIYEGYAYLLNDPEDSQARGDERREEARGMAQLRTGAEAAELSPPPKRPRRPK